jgi:hypothetical protein
MTILKAPEYLKILLQESKTVPELYTYLGNRTVAFDFDETLAYRDKTGEMKPNPGMVSATWNLHNNGLFILILSARVNISWGEENYLKNIRRLADELDVLDIYYDDIWTLPGKPLYRWMLCDMAYNYKEPDDINKFYNTIMDDFTKLPYKWSEEG